MGVKHLILHFSRTRAPYVFRSSNSRGQHFGGGIPFWDARIESDAMSSPRRSPKRWCASVDADQHGLAARWFDRSAPAGTVCSEARRATYFWRQK